MSDRAVLLTGATGFVGMEVMARYLERSDREVLLLVRARDDDEAAARLRKTLGSLYGDEDAYADRVTAVAADIEREALGLPPERRREMAERVSDIVHAAASVSFSLPLDDLRRINVAGTERLLEFARQAQESGGLDRFCYVSTAYVAGTHEGEFREDQLDVGQDFRNAYERSKFEAERLVRDHADRALAAARAKLRQLELINQWMRDEYGFDKSFRMGIGLNSGNVMSGNVGSETRMAYTTIGDTTNTAARLEGMTKGTDHQVYLADSTCERLPEKPPDVAFVGELPVRGRQRTLRVWTLETA